MTEYWVLFVLGAVVFGGVWWTAWDIRSDLRRRRLK